MVRRDQDAPGVVPLHRGAKEFRPNPFRQAVRLDAERIDVVRAVRRGAGRPTREFRDRQQLARDLHDSVTQTLFSASVIAEMLPILWTRDPEQIKPNLDQLRQLTSGALSEMRDLLDKAEKINFVSSADKWMQIRELRNKMLSAKAESILRLHPRRNYWIV